MCNSPELSFDVANQGYTNWWFPAVGLGFMALCSLQFIRERSWPQHKRHLRTKLGLAFTTLWTAAALVTTLGEYLDARAARKSGEFQTVEGVVEDFVSPPYSGHGKERFTVGGVPFQYSDAILSAGYHQSRAHGGAVEPGLHVRIGYVKNEILKLEVCR